MAEMQFKIKAMNRDLALSNFNSEFAYEIYNMRVMATDSQTSFALTNEKGPLDVFVEFSNSQDDISNIVKGTVVGGAILNNKLYVITHRVGRSSASLEDRIYEITLDDTLYPTIVNLLDSENCPQQEEGKDYINLDLDTEHPLDIIPYYESEDIQKLYWIDGKNQARMFNVISRNLTFDFLPEVSTNNIITIEKKAGGGKFPAGVIQYCFTFSVNNGQESNIFYTSPLYYITRDNNYGLPVGEEAECSFQINFDKLTFGYFDCVNVYSILRTAYNGEVECRKVGSFTKDNILNKTLTYEQWDIQGRSDNEVINTTTNKVSCNSPSVTILKGLKVATFNTHAEDFKSALKVSWLNSLKTALQVSDADFPIVVGKFTVTGEDPVYHTIYKLVDGDIQYVEGLDLEHCVELNILPNYSDKIFNITVVTQNGNTNYILSPDVELNNLWWAFDQETPDTNQIDSIISENITTIALTDVVLDEITAVFDNINKDQLTVEYITKSVGSSEYIQQNYNPIFISGYVIDSRDTLQETVPISHLLITCQRPKVIPQTIANKDNTLFIGNLKVHSSTIPQNIKDVLRNEDSWKDEPGTKLKINPNIKQEQRPIGNSEVVPFSTNNSSSVSLYSKEQECCRLSLNSQERKIFKSREYYRLGIQFSNSRMEKSEVVDLGYTKINPLVISGIQILSSYPVYQIPNTNVVLSDGSSCSLKQALYALGWTSARLMIQEVSPYEKSIIAQGVVCPTIFNMGQRVQDGPTAISSWFFRSFGTKAPLPNKHFDVLTDNTHYNCEIQSISYTPSKDEIFDENETEPNVYYEMWVGCKAENFNLHRHKDTCIIFGYIIKKEGDSVVEKHLFNGSRALGWHTLTKRKNHYHDYDYGKVQFNQFTTQGGSVDNFTDPERSLFVSKLNDLSISGSEKIDYGPFCTKIKAGDYEKDCKAKIISDVAALVSKTLKNYGLGVYVENCLGVQASFWDQKISKVSGKYFTGNASFKFNVPSIKQDRDQSVFLVDNNIVDFYTPEDTSLLQSTNQSVNKLRLLGVATLNSTRADGKITLETSKHSSLASGVLPIPYANRFTCAYWGYNDDYLLPTNYNSEDIAFSNDVYMIYPWHRETCLGAQKNSGSISVTTNPSELDLTNPSVEYQNTIFGKAKTKCLFNGRDYNIYEYINCGNYSIFGGDVSDTMANNGTIKFAGNKFSTQYITYQGSPDFIYVPKIKGAYERFNKFLNPSSSSEASIISWPWRENPNTNFSSIQKNLHSQGLYCIWAQNKALYVKYLNNSQTATQNYIFDSIIAATDDDEERTVKMYFLNVPTESTTYVAEQTYDVPIRSITNYEFLFEGLPIFIVTIDGYQYTVTMDLSEMLGLNSNLAGHDIYPSWLWPYITNGFNPTDYTESSLRGKYINKRLYIDNITVADPINIKFTTSPHLVCQLGAVQVTETQGSNDEELSVLPEFYICNESTTEQNPEPEPEP